MSALSKDLSHLRGMLDYAWRSGRADRNVLDGFSLQDSLRKVEPMDPAQAKLAFQVISER